jgi:nitroreductase
LKPDTAVRRRAFVALGPAAGLAALGLPACSASPDLQAYEAVATRTWQPVSGAAIAADGLPLELVRCATLAPSSHNTQCWRFALSPQAIRVQPDFARRCPAVDPDDHHLYISLGCAVENLAQAALAHGLHAEARYEAGDEEVQGRRQEGVQVRLSPTAALVSPLFQAMALRASTRGDYDGQPLAASELAALAQAGRSPQVRLRILTGRAALETVLDHVIAANTAQMADPAFMRELQSWIRFNGAEAVRTGDGLYSAASGSPNVPGWLGRWAFPWLLTPKGENERYARQIRNAAGIAVFSGLRGGPANWVEVGRCYERFALQAAVLGVRVAMLNQPVEVAARRAPFATAAGMAGERPDLVVRFGHGPAMPRSLRRPVQAVLV